MYHVTHNALYLYLPNNPSNISTLSSSNLLSHTLEMNCNIALFCASVSGWRSGRIATDDNRRGKTSRVGSESYGLG